MRRALLPPVFLALPIVWLFRRALFGGEMFAFRDSAHYYFPLYKYIQDRWRSGLPLWNPLDGIGQPLLADPTAAVLYPGKLVFFLPLPFALCFVIYVTMHLWIAGYGTYLCARTFRTGVGASLLAGLAYELSGQVLFQYCNPIYCVGAAWLPWAVLFMERAFLRGCWVHALRLAIVFCLMVLGGDPQMAYHCVLIGLLRIACLQPHLRFPAARLLLQSCIVGLAMSAIQVLPAYEWASHSDRIITSAPPSVWSWTVESLSGQRLASFDSMWQRPLDNASHPSKVYDFSVGPWRWSELFWPNVSGPLFPIHGRWIEGLPGEGRMWSPSIYLGVLPIALALYRLRLGRSSSRVRWLSWLVVFSTVAAMGEYGIGWLLNEIRYLFFKEDYEASAILPGIGGVYWFLTVTLPSYASFRYPAKWWTVASFGLSLLAAKGWVMIWTRHRVAMSKRFGITALCFVLPTLIAAWILIGQGQVPPNVIFGPFDPELARASIIGSIGHVVIVAATLLLLAKPRRQIFQAMVLGVCTLELIVAQQNAVQTRPASEWLRSGQHAITCVYRCDPTLVYPQVWKSTSSSHRFADLQRFDRQTFMPKHHLSDGIRSVRSAVAMSNAEYEAIWNVATEKSGGATPATEMLSVLGVDTIVGPEGFSSNSASDRAWLVGSWRRVPIQRTRSREQLMQLTRDAWLTGDEFRDLRAFATVESNEEFEDLASASNTQANECKLVIDQPEQIQIEAAVESDSILVLRDLYFPGWEVQVRSDGQAWKEASLLRTNRVMRGVKLGPGRHTVRFRYRPKTVVYGGIMSGIAIACVICLLIRSRLGSSRLGSSRLGSS